MLTLACMHSHTCTKGLCRGSAYGVGWVGDLSPQPGPAQATDRHWAMERGLGTPDLTSPAHLNLKLPSTENPRLDGFTDADWAEDIADQKSTSSYAFFYVKVPVCI